MFSLYYISQVLGLGRELALQSALLGSIVSLCIIPIGGLLADHIGPSRAYVIALIVAGIASGIFFPLVNSREIALVYLAVVLCTASLGLALSAQGALFSGQFATEFRASGFMLGRETCTALFSGLTPVFAALLFGLAGYVALACLTVGVCLVSIVATLIWLPNRSLSGGFK